MRILLLTDDRPGARMAGPAIRTIELARQLATRHEVTVGSTQPAGEGLELPFPLHGGLTSAAMETLAQQADVLVAGGFLYAQHPQLLRSNAWRVLDLYDPVLLEDLTALRGELGAYQLAEHRHWLDTQMRQADFMVCASERQRDYWLGRLCALGRLDLAMYAQDPTARQLIDVVPFGLPATPPAAGTPVLRALPGIGAADVVALWGGGLWDWFDPLTPIRAVAALGAEAPKLVFLAGRSPNPGTPPMPMAETARALARELGVLGTQVHFIEEWVPYETRGSLLLEADLAFSAHRDHLETRFAFRTRVLDYLWAGLPILTTRGDTMGDLVQGEGLGEALEDGDVAGWTRALGRMRAEASWRAACAARTRAVAPRFTWERAIAPLAAYCAAPTRRSHAVPPPHLGGPLGLAAKGLLALKDEGLEGLMGRVRRKLARGASE